MKEWFVIESSEHWIPRESERDFGLDVGWEVVKFVDFDKPGEKHTIMLGYGLTERLARMIAQRLND